MAARLNIISETMKTDNIDNLPHGDILAAKLRRIQRPAFPEGLEDKIMLRVQATAAKRGRRKIFRYIAASVSVAVSTFGVVFTVLYFTGITGAEISSIFSPIGNMFGNIGESMENLASAWSPTYTITSAVLLTGLLYISVNEILSGRSTRKVLEKELDV